MKYAKVAVLAVICLALIAGCAHKEKAAPPPPGPAMPSAVYNNGVLQTAFPVSFDQAWNTTLATLGQLRMPIVRTDKVVGGTIDATGTDGTPVRIKLTPSGLGATVVSIQVGSGNERASRLINEALANNLGMKVY